MVHRSEAAVLGSFALVCVFVLSLPLVTTRIYASDEVESFAWVRSWVFDRDVNFENEYQHFYDSRQVQTASFHETFLERENEAGRRLNFMPIGTAILWLPFYGAGHLAALATGAPADGFSAPYVAAVAYGSAIYGFLAVVLSLGDRAAAGGPRPGGEPRDLDRHAAAVLHVRRAADVARVLRVRGVAVSLDVAARPRALEPSRRRRARADGRAHGDGARAGRLLSRGAGDRFRALGGPRRRPASSVVYGLARGSLVGCMRCSRGVAAFLVAYLPQLAAYNALNGHPGPTTYVTRKMTWTAPHSLQVLFSPEHGLFAWTPLALLAIAGLVLLALGRVPTAARESRWLAVAAARDSFALQVYVNGSVESWTVAGSFGQRRFVAITPLLVAGLASLAVAWSGLVRRRWLHAVAVLVVAAGIWWNVGLMIQFGLNRMDRQRLTLRDNMWTTFVVLPADAPGILWRYLTNRESFYGLPHQ